MYYRIITLSFRSKKFPGELPGGPVVRVLPYISTAGAMGSIPGPEAKISHATQGNQNKQTNKQTNKPDIYFRNGYPISLFLLCIVLSSEIKQSKNQS